MKWPPKILISYANCRNCFVDGGGIIINLCFCTLDRNCLQPRNKLFLGDCVQVIIFHCFLHFRKIRPSLNFSHVHFHQPGNCVDSRGYLCFNSFQCHKFMSSLTFGIYILYDILEDLSTEIQDYVNRMRILQLELTFLHSALHPIFSHFTVYYCVLLFTYLLFLDISYGIICLRFYVRGIFNYVMFRL